MEKRSEIKFIDVMWLFVDSHFSINTLNEKTRNNYDAYVRSVIEFFNLTGRPNVLITDIDSILMDDLLVFLRKRGGLTNACRAVEICKRSMEFARKRKMILVNEILDFKTTRDKTKEVIHLEENELQEFIYPQLMDRQNQIVNDLYIFQCETGMAYGDLWSYQIIKDSCGEWVFNKRNKNGNQYWVPLSSLAKRIHEKYNGKLPRVTNTIYNQKLRTLSKKRGISKYLTTHTARKTFATISYQRGWSTESIADMMGVSITILLKHYIKKSRKRLENEVLAMQVKIDPLHYGEVKLKIV